MNIHLQHRGIALVEVLVAVTILLLMLVALALSVTGYVDARKELINETKATYLANDGYEILRAVRDTNWITLKNLTIGTTYYLSVSTTTLAVSNTPEIINGSFRRSFVVQALYRDSNDDIVSSTTPGAVSDTNSREIRISVAGPTGTTSLSGILTNIQGL